MSTTNLLILLVEIELAVRIINARFNLNDEFECDFVDEAVKCELYVSGTHFEQALEKKSNNCISNKNIDDVIDSIYQNVALLPLVPKQSFYDGQYKSRF